MDTELLHTFKPVARTPGMLLDGVRYVPVADDVHVDLALAWRRDDPSPVLARLGVEQGLELEVEQGGQAAVGGEDDVAAMPAIAPSWSAVRSVLLAQECDAAATASTHQRPASIPSATSMPSRRRRSRRSSMSGPRGARR